MSIHLTYLREGVAHDLVLEEGSATSSVFHLDGRDYALKGDESENGGNFTTYQYYPESDITIILLSHSPERGRHTDEVGVELAEILFA